MKSKLGLNPWLSIWVKPRQTIRALIKHDVNFRFILISAIYGFQFMLQFSQTFSIGSNFNLIVILLMALILSIPVGYILFNISSAFLFWLGKLIKGKGSFKEVRAANYWSSIPNVITILVWIILMFAHGNSLFIAGYEKGLAGAGMGMNIGASIVQIVLGIWMIVIFLRSLGEVQGFSAWMALLNAFLSVLAMFIISFVVLWGVSAITHVS